MRLLGLFLLEIKMNIPEFFEACKKFDWYYEFSDDGRVWREGTAAREKLLKEAKDDLVKKQIFTDWSNYMFTGEGWSTPKAPEPKLENYHD